MSEIWTFENRTCPTTRRYFAHRLRVREQSSKNRTLAQNIFEKIMLISLAQSSGFWTLGTIKVSENQRGIIYNYNHYIIFCYHHKLLILGLYRPVLTAILKPVCTGLVFKETTFIIFEMCDRARYLVFTGNFFFFLGFRNFRCCS